MFRARARQDYVVRLRLATLGLALAATVVKLLLAATTLGTDDVRFWYEFARGVRAFGPVDIYGHSFTFAFNHAPLSGWFLKGLNWLVDHDVARFPFLLRAPSSVADFATAALVFELIRGRVPPEHDGARRAAVEAALAAVLVAWSPVAIAISGFHGNTDSVFVMSALLALYLVARTQGVVLGALGGVAFAAALSIKLVPVVLAPILAVALFRQGWRRLLAFATGALMVFGPLWGPVLRWRWVPFRDNVLGYAGVAWREWGLIKFASWLDAPESLTRWLVTPGRFVVVLLCSLLPALIVFQRREALVPAAGLALSMFMLLSPAFGMQYLCWPLAGAYLVSFGAASLYNVAASVLTLVVYSRWNGGTAPWDWNDARASAFVGLEYQLMVVTWLALGSVVAVGLWYLLRRRAPSTVPAPAVAISRP
jgi:hypothetical protein